MMKMMRYSRYLRAVCFILGMFLGAAFIFCYARIFQILGLNDFSNQLLSDSIIFYFFYIKKSHFCVSVIRFHSKNVSSSGKNKIASLMM